MPLLPRARCAAPLLAAALLAVSAIGCSQGPPTGKVHGKVTFKGQPVKEGRVTLLNPTEGGAYEGLIAEGGVYTVPNPVLVGDYVVVVTPLTHIVDTDPGKTPPSAVEKPAPDIPRKYRMQGQTPLKASVKQGENELNLDLTP
jgi:hypothetical protein